eukprot:g464.t1
MAAFPPALRPLPMVTPCSIPVAACLQGNPSSPSAAVVLRTACSQRSPRKHPVLLTSPLPRDAVKTDPTTAAAALSRNLKAVRTGSPRWVVSGYGLDPEETRDPEAPGSDGGEATNGAQLLYDELHLLAQDQSQTGLTGSEEAEEPEERSWDLVAANQELWEHLDQQEAFLRKANAEILKHREAYLRHGAGFA